MVLCPVPVPVAVGRRHPAPRVCSGTWAEVAGTGGGAGLGRRRSTEMVSLRPPALAPHSNPRALSAAMPGGGGSASAHAASTSGSSSGKQMPTGTV